MTDARGNAARDVVVLRTLAELVKAAREQANQAALDTARVGERTVAALPDDTEVGVVTVCRGKLAPKVTDMAKLLAWVKEFHPTEVQTVEQIRPMFLSKILARVKDDGEVIPGTDLSRGDPYTSTTVMHGAAEAIAKAWANGSLPLPTAVLGELEAGQ